MYPQSSKRIVESVFNATSPQQQHTYQTTSSTTTNKRQQLTVNDIPTAEFVPVTSTKLSVPKLSDQRAIDLGAAFSKFLIAPSADYLQNRIYKTPAQTIAESWQQPCVDILDDALCDLLLRGFASSSSSSSSSNNNNNNTTSTSWTRKSSSSSSATTIHHRRNLTRAHLIAKAPEELFLTLQAFFKLTHGAAADGDNSNNGTSSSSTTANNNSSSGHHHSSSSSVINIRVHDELAVNTGVNIAEFFLLEQGFSRAFCKMFSEFKKLPSLGLFLLRMIVTEGSVLSTALAPRQLPDLDKLREEAFFSYGFDVDKAQKDDYNNNSNNASRPGSTSSNSRRQQSNNNSNNENGDFGGGGLFGSNNNNNNHTSSSNLSLLQQRQRIYANSLMEATEVTVQQASSDISSSNHYHQNNNNNSTTTKLPVSLMDQRRKERVLEKLRQFQIIQEEEKRLAASSSSSANAQKQQQQTPHFYSAAADSTMSNSPNNNNNNNNNNNADRLASAAQQTKIQNEKKAAFEDKKEAEVAWDWDRAMMGRNRTQIARWSGSMGVMMSTIQKALPDQNILNYLSVQEMQHLINVAAAVAKNNNNNNNNNSSSNKNSSNLMTKFEKSFLSSTSGPSPMSVSSPTVAGSFVRRKSLTSTGGNGNSTMASFRNNFSGNPFSPNSASNFGSTSLNNNNNNSSSAATQQINPTFASLLSNPEENQKMFGKVHLLHQMSYETSTAARDALEQCITNLTIGSKILLPPLMRFQSREANYAAARKHSVSLPNPHQEGGSRTRGSSAKAKAEQQQQRSSSSSTNNNNTNKNKNSNSENNNNYQNTQLFNEDGTPNFQSAAAAAAANSNTNNLLVFQIPDIGLEKMPRIGLNAPSPMKNSSNSNNNNNKDSDQTNNQQHPNNNNNKQRSASGNNRTNSRSTTNTQNVSNMNNNNINSSSLSNNNIGGGGANINMTTTHLSRTVSKEEVRNQFSLYDANASPSGGKNVNIYIECSQMHAFSMKPFCQDLRSAKTRARAAKLEKEAMEKTGFSALKANRNDIAAAYQLLQKFAGAASSSARKNDEDDEDYEDDDDEFSSDDDSSGNSSDSSDDDKSSSDNDDSNSFDDDDSDGDDSLSISSNNDSNRRRKKSKNNKNSNTNKIVRRVKSIRFEGIDDENDESQAAKSTESSLSASHELSVGDDDDDNDNEFSPSRRHNNKNPNEDSLSITTTHNNDQGEEEVEISFSNNNNNVIYDSLDVTRNSALSVGSSNSKNDEETPSPSSHQSFSPAVSNQSVSKKRGSRSRSRSPSSPTQQHNHNSLFGISASSNHQMEILNNSSSINSSPSQQQQQQQEAALPSSTTTSPPKNNTTTNADPFMNIPKFQPLEADALMSQMNNTNNKKRNSTSSKQQQQRRKSSTTSHSSATRAALRRANNNINNAGEESAHHHQRDIYLLRPFVVAEYLGYDPEQNRINFRITAETRPRKNVEKFCADVLEGVADGEEHADQMFNRLATRFLKSHCCPKHKALHLSHYCHNCDIFVCESCVVETHPTHDVIPRSAYCTQKIAQMQPMKEMFEKRIALLKSLQGQVTDSEKRLLASVDSALGHCRSALENRRNDLKSDALARGNSMQEVQDREFELNNMDISKVREALDIVQNSQRRGILRTAPFIELHLPGTIRNETDLLLPSRVVHQVIQSLDWSLTAKHLNQVVYPSPEEIAREEEKAKRNQMVPIASEKKKGFVALMNNNNNKNAVEQK